MYQAPRLRPDSKVSHYGPTRNCTLHGGFREPILHKKLMICTPEPVARKATCVLRAAFLSPARTPPARPTSRTRPMSQRWTARPSAGPECLLQHTESNVAKERGEDDWGQRTEKKRQHATAKLLGSSAAPTATKYTPVSPVLGGGAKPSGADCPPIFTSAWISQNTPSYLCRSR